MKKAAEKEIGMIQNTACTGQAVENKNNAKLNWLKSDRVRNIQRRKQKKQKNVQSGK